MFFKGTERRPTARDIAGEVDSIGGEFNAFTGKEYTGYYVKCAAEHRDVALDVLVDMLRNSKFDAGEIDREKGVIIEEMNMYFDTPRDFVDGVYEELVYGGPPARLGHHRPQGDGAGRDARHVPGLPRPLVQAVAHGRRRRRPDRRRPARADRGAARRPRGRADRLAAARAQPVPNGRRVKVHTKAVRPGAHLPRRPQSRPIVDPDRYVLMVLSTVLGGGMSSRLFTEVRERRGLAYYVFATNHAYTDAGSLYSQAGVDIERIDEAVGTIAAELRKIAAEPVPEDELARRRTSRRAASSSSSRARTG